ncbi:MAG: MlaD family protein [Desulfobacterales bacterium]
MAKQANTMMIGGFVLMAVFILAASVVILGSGKLFKRTESFVLYFDSSIKGLNVGAPVVIQGVQVGSVTKILIRTNRKDLSMNIPVFIEIDLDRFDVDGPEEAESNPEEAVEELINRGLRAVLGMQSFITGQLMIELDFHPDSPANLKKIDTDYPEIPTIPSTTERLIQTLQKIDFVSLADQVANTMAGVDQLVNNPDISEGLKSFRQTADESRELVGKIDSSIDDLIGDIEGIFGDTRVLVNNADAQVKPIADDLRQLIGHFDELALNIKKQVDAVAGNLNESLNGFSGVVSEDAPLVIQMEETLQNIANMADSIRQLADYLEQHPESLLRGKGN